LAILAQRPDRIVDNVLLAVMGEDTKYAAGFSEEKFRSIHVGDSEDYVRQILGPPLTTVSSGREATEEALLYSQSPSSTHYRRRGLVIRNGVVSSIVSDVWID
jgi:hypothetical protein